MSSTFMSLETARRGMKVQQNALEVTGHNLANASTPGYSRQEVVLSTTDPYCSPNLNSSATPGQYGTGVQVESIRRIRDEYMDNSVRQATTASGYWSSQTSPMELAEAAFAEPGTEGIGKNLSDFFKSWMNLNNNPQDPGSKASTVELGREFANMMTDAYKQMDNIQSSVSTQMDDQVKLANDITTKLRDLNTAINKLYNYNQQPNDLLDQQDVLLEKLSNIVPITVTYKNIDGQASGLIDSLKVNGVDISLDPASPDHFNLSVTGSGDSSNITLNYGTGIGGDTPILALTDNHLETNIGGGLLGLENARQNVIKYKSYLDNLVVGMRDEIDKTFCYGDYDPTDSAHSDPAIYSATYDPTDPSQSFFFQGSLATNDFQVIAALSIDPSGIDGTQAGRVASLHTDALMSGGTSTTGPKTSTFEQYYATLVTQVGNDTSGANGMSNNKQAISKQITALRDSISGVSVDEEITRMMQYQYSFQASAKMINTIDGMLDVIINHLF